MNTITTEITVKPKTKEELLALIGAEIKQNGNQCDLNHIDVSLINDFSCLFYNSEFNGDISSWDVSRVKNMRFTFAASKFNGDVSKWDVSGAENMGSMFRHSKFRGNVSDWNRFSIKNDDEMFTKTEIAKKLGIKNPSFDQVKSHFLTLKLEAVLQEPSPRQGGLDKIRL